MNKDSRTKYERTLRVFEEESNVKDRDTLRKIMRKLHRYETELQKISEAGCNVKLTEEQWKLIAEKEMRIKAKVEDIVINTLGFSVGFDDDPRGFHIRILLPSARSNLWDGFSWGITW